MDCFTGGIQAGRYCGNSYSKVTSVTCLCKIVQVLGSITSHSLVVGVIAHDIGDSLGFSVCVCVCQTCKMSVGQNIREMLRRNLKHNKAM
jgi:hypothetical protein